MKWYWFESITKYGIWAYIGKCQTTEAEISRRFHCSIDGCLVKIWRVKKEESK